MKHRINLASPWFKSQLHHLPTRLRDLGQVPNLWAPPAKWRLPFLPHRFVEDKKYVCEVPGASIAWSHIIYYYLDCFHFLLL